MDKIKTYLPIFNGFYNSIFEFDYNYINESIAQNRKENGLYSELKDDIDIDYKAYENDIAINLYNVIKEKLSNYVFEIEFESVYNPKTYNFYNDSINVIITPNIESIKNFIYSNKDKFIEYLKEKYTSYDGFISHYSNDFQSWESETKNFTVLNNNGHILGSILDFIACVEGINELDIYEDVIENIDLFEYVKNYEYLINYNDNSLFELFRSKGHSKEHADYLTSSYYNNVINNLCLSENELMIIKEFESLQA